MISLRNSVNKNEIFENGNADEVINIVELTFDFDKNVKSKVLKILIPKRIFSRLSKTFKQVKTGNNLKNYYSLYRSKGITKKYMKI